MSLDNNNVLDLETLENNPNMYDEWIEHNKKHNSIVKYCAACECELKDFMHYNYLCQQCFELEQNKYE